MGETTLPPDPPFSNALSLEEASDAADTGVLQMLQILVLACWAGQSIALTLFKARLKHHSIHSEYFSALLQY